MRNLFFALLIIIVLILMVVTIGALYIRISTHSSAEAVRAETAALREQPPQPSAKRKTIFQCQSDALSVEIIGDFNNWQKETLKKQIGNNWYIIRELEPGEYKYNFVVDGKEAADPRNMQKTLNPQGQECSVIKIK